MSPPHRRRRGGGVVLVGGRRRRHRRRPLGHGLARRGALVGPGGGAAPEALHVLALQGLHEEVLGASVQASVVVSNRELRARHDQGYRLPVKILHECTNQDEIFIWYHHQSLTTHN